MSLYIANGIERQNAASQARRAKDASAQLSDRLNTVEVYRCEVSPLIDLTACLIADLEYVKKMLELIRAKDGGAQ